MRCPEVPKACGHVRWAGSATRLCDGFCMKIKDRLHDWDVSCDEARRIQEKLVGRVKLSAPPRQINLIAGADMALDKRRGVFFASAVVLSFPLLEVVEEHTAHGRASFPYVPGLLSFREGPIVLKALAGLEVRPDVVIFDGQPTAVEAIYVAAPGDPDTDGPEFLLTVLTTDGVAAPEPARYQGGTVVELNAPRPPADLVFDRWSGDLAGSENPIAVTMDRDITVTANYSRVGAFVPPPPCGLGLAEASLAALAGLTLRSMCPRRRCGRCRTRRR